jgi:hypothetical protein
MDFQTIAQRIGQLAQEPNPRLFASIPTPTGSRRDVSYRQFENLINQTASWLDENLPEPSIPSEFPTFAYIGAVDLRRIALVIASAKTGRKVHLLRHDAQPGLTETLLDPFGP